MDLYLSAPGVVVPGAPRTNEAILDAVRARFRGPDDAWPAIRRRIELVFRLCGTRVRYQEPEPGGKVATYAAAAGRRCLEAAGLDANDLDMVIGGSIARDYFEPATATEIAAALGLERVQAFDVASACAGLMQGIHVAAGLMHMHAEIERALVCAADLIADGISYDIQDADDVAIRAAGLTLGDGASAFVVSRRPPPVGGRILGILTETLPQHHALCSVPKGGTFRSHSAELFKLHRHVPEHVRELLRRCGKTPGDVHHWVSHQPSDAIVARTLDELRVPRERAILCHGLYGNTVNSTIPMAMERLLAERGIAEGELVALTAAAGGFTMVSLLLEWGPGRDPT